MGGRRGAPNPHGVPGARIDEHGGPEIGGSPSPDARRSPVRCGGATIPSAPELGSAGSCKPWWSNRFGESGKDDRDTVVIAPFDSHVRVSVRSIVGPIDHAYSAGLTRRSDVELAHAEPFGLRRWVLSGDIVDAHILLQVCRDSSLVDEAWAERFVGGLALKVVAGVRLYASVEVAFSDLVAGRIRRGSHELRAAQATIASDSESELLLRSVHSW